MRARLQLSAFIDRCSPRGWWARRPVRLPPASRRRGRRVRDPHDRLVDARVRAETAGAPSVHWSARAMNVVGEPIETLFGGYYRVGQFLRERSPPRWSMWRGHAVGRLLRRRCRSSDAIGFRMEAVPFGTADAIGIERVIEVAPRSARTARPSVPELWKHRLPAHVRSWRFCAARRISRAS